MIRLLLAGAMFVGTASAQPSVPPNRKAGEWCRGIHMPDATGGANLLLTTIRGRSEQLKVVGEQMRALGATVATKEAQHANSELIASYRDDLDVKAIGGLLNQIDAGSFGPLETEDSMMPLDTLPADRCIRFLRKP